MRVSVGNVESDCGVSQLVVLPLLNHEIYVVILYLLLAACNGNGTHVRRIAMSWRRSKRMSKSFTDKAKHNSMNTPGILAFCFAFRVVCFVLFCFVSAFPIWFWFFLCVFINFE